MVNIHGAKGATQNVIVSILVQLLYDLLRLGHLIIFKAVELFELIVCICDGTNLLIAHLDKPVLQA